MASSMTPGDPTITWPARAGFETKFLTMADGTRLRILLAGPKTGQRVVLVHGFPQNAASWRKVVRALGDVAGDDVRSILVDLRGYAGSDLSTSGRYDLATLAGDLIAVLEQTSGEGAPGPAILVAHDWGGVIAWEVAARRPELVKHLITMNGPHRAAYLRELKTNARQRRGSYYVGFFNVPLIEHLLSANGAGIFIEGMRKSSRPGTFSDEDLEIYVGPFRDPKRLRAALDYYRESTREFTRNRGRISDTRQISVPVTILWGRRDTAIVPNVAERVVDEYAPEASIRWLQEATHWVPDEEPEAVARAILDARAS
jgi:epoxide hydrolase 4